MLWQIKYNTYIHKYLLTSYHWMFQFLLYTHTRKFVFHYSLSIILLNTWLLIVEKKPKRFKIDRIELTNRREFINQTRASVKVRIMCSVYWISHDVFICNLHFSACITVSCNTFVKFCVMLAVLSSTFTSAYLLLLFIRTSVSTCTTSNPMLCTSRLVACITKVSQQTHDCQAYLRNTSASWYNCMGNLVVYNSEL